MEHAIRKCEKDENLEAGTLVFTWDTFNERWQILTVVGNDEHWNGKKMGRFYLVVSTETGNVFTRPSRSLYVPK